MDMKALLIGGGKPGKSEAPEAAGEDRRSLAEAAFLKAIARKAGVADALEELMAVIDGVDEEDAIEPGLDQEMDAD